MVKRFFVSFVLLIISTNNCFGWDFSDIHGFAEGAYAPKFKKDGTKHASYNMAESRLQLKTKYYFEGDSILSDWQTVINIKSDFILDYYWSAKAITDLRELNLMFNPLKIVDIKIGRQVLTWGTGDYLFLNDLFPKDYISFFIGRDDEYLKLPSDALRIMIYPDLFNVDLVFIPFFLPNIVPEGERVSFFDTFTGKITGRESERHFVEPSKTFENSVYAGRVYRNFSNYEGALYFYRGFDPSPRSYKNEELHQLYYERLDAYGASLRGPFMDGIINSEFSYYFSAEDNAGKRRTIQNSMMKYLVGYEKDLGGDLSISFQYYLEQTLNYDNYREALLDQDYRWDEYRHLITNRVTKFFANQTLKISIFTFFSPTDMEIYMRPSIVWKATDSWTLSFGANLAWGEDLWTEFSSIEKNKNVYMRLRYSF